MYIHMYIYIYMKDLRRALLLAKAGFHKLVALLGNKHSMMIILLIIQIMIMIMIVDNIDNTD